MPSGDHGASGRTMRDGISFHAHHWPRGLPGCSGRTRRRCTWRARSVAFSWYDAGRLPPRQDAPRENADNRTDAPQLLGQARWTGWYGAGTATPFKLVAVGGRVLNTAVVFGNHANFPEERAELLAGREGHHRGHLLTDRRCRTIPLPGVKRPRTSGT